MKIRYAIEKEIEVPDSYSDEMIDDVIKEKGLSEEGLSWIWQDEDETTELFEFFSTETDDEAAEVNLLDVPFDEDDSPLAPASRAMMFVKNNFINEIDRVLNNFADNLYHTTLTNSISQEVKTEVLNDVVARLKKLGYIVKVSRGYNGKKTVTISWR